MGISLSNVVDYPQLLGYRIYIKECSNGYFVIAYIFRQFGYQPCCQNFTYTHQNKYRMKLPNNQSENTIKLMEPMFHIKECHNKYYMDVLLLDLQAYLGIFQISICIIRWVWPNMARMISEKPSYAMVCDIDDSIIF